MTHSRTVLITSSLALALFCGAAQAQPSAQAQADDHPANAGDARAGARHT